MDNIISLLQEIFMGKDNVSFKVGLSDYKKTETPIRHSNVKSSKKHAPQELRLSELMRKGSY